MVDVNLRISALDKLVEYVASGIGAVCGPMLARRNARVAAESDQIEAQGKAEALRINVQGQADALSLIGRTIADPCNTSSHGGEFLRGHIEIHSRGEIESRVTFQEQRRASNIRTVVGMAARDVKDAEVNNHEVDHDWTVRFFTEVQDVTSEGMQRMWAKILSGEIKAPGRTSLHTLAVLKNMSQRDAELFSEVSKFVLVDFIFSGGEYLQDVAGYPSFENLVKLESYNLVKTSQFLRKTIPLPNSKFFIARSGNTLYRVFLTGNETPIKVPCYALTPQGKELYSLTEATLDSGCARALARFISEKGSLKLEQQRILGKEGDNHIASPWEPVPF